ncbi:MAG: PAS domain S-box protein [Spirochaetes bacterium]|nr:PAS domain S-box protein [Spirochaetota bacterium]
MKNKQKTKKQFAEIPDECLPGYILEIDRKGTIYYCNKSCAGLGREQIAGTNIRDYFRPGDRAGIVKAVGKAFRTGKPQVCEVMLKETGGNPVRYKTHIDPVIIDDRAVSAILYPAGSAEFRGKAGMQPDMDRIAAEIIKDVPVPMIVVDLNGRIFHVNDEFERITGWEMEKVAGKTAAEIGIVSADDRKRIKKEVLPELMREGSVRNFEITAVRKDGTRFNILMNWRLMQDTEGRPGNIVITATDITERKRAKEKIIRQRDELDVRSRIISRIFGTFDLDKRLNLFLDETLAFTGIENGMIFLVKDTDIELRSWRGISENFRAGVMKYSLDKYPEMFVKRRIIHERQGGKGEIPGFAKREGIQSWACFPLYSSEDDREEFIGTLILADSRYDVLGSDDVRMLDSMVEQLALAVDHVRRYREAKERLARLKILHGIDNLIIKRLDIQNILNVVLEKVPEELGADAVAISLLENEKNTQVFAMRLPNGKIIKEEAFFVADSLMYWFINRREPVVINDLTQDRRVRMYRRYIHKHRLVSYIGVPMIAQDKTIGIFHLLTTDPRVFKKEDVAFYRTLAGQAAIALKSAQLFEKTLESEKRYRSIFDNAAEGIYRASLDGKLLIANPAMANMLGYDTPEQFIFETENINRIYVNSRDREEFLRILKEKRIVKNFETRIYHRDKSVVYILKSAQLVSGEEGEPLYYEEICTDITRRKQTELELKESEEKYRNLVEHANDGICIIQGRKFKYCNFQLAEMLGGTPEEIIGTSFTDYIVSDNLSKVIKHYEKRMAGKHVSSLYEAAFKRRDGSTGYADVKGNIIIYQGRPADFIIVRDITERKRREEEKEKLQSQFLQAQKMEAVGRLAGGIAHDFNNMLTAIIGYSDFILLQLDKNSPMRKHIKEIMNAGKRASVLAHDLLAFSRNQPLQKTVLDLNEVIANTENMMRRLIDEDIKLTTISDPGLEMVNADSGQIEQVLMNLIVNARDAMPRGGKITIRTENVTIDKEYCKIYTYARPGKYICLSVEDNGTGMDEETLNHIFEPFFTTKERGKGTGLGLSAVYGIVKQHDGWINADSEPGYGTAFKIYLPAFSISRDNTAAVEEDSALLGNFQGNNSRILLVEDEEEVLRFLEYVLSSNGYIVFESSNAAEALEIFKREDGDFQLIFSDVLLPDMNGVELVDELLLHKPDLKVILASGYMDDKAQLPFIRERGFCFLQKPFTAIDLLRTVKETMEHI